MPGTRLFFAICLAAALGLVILVPVLGGAFAARTVSDDVTRGFGVWRSYGCAGCHTLDGQGGPYAPDLTRIYSVRGDTYLREFLINPGALHPDAIRTMPRLGLTETESSDVIAFLKWVGDQSATFPPRPINVSGGLPESAASSASAAPPSASSTSEVPSDPVAAGHYWFTRPPANCATCHSLQPDVVLVGPSLANVGNRAGSRRAGMTAEQYLRQSILDPGAFVVPGFPNAMARNFGEVLNGEQISDLIAFLMTQTQADQTK